MPTAIILSADLQFQTMSKEEANRLLLERIKFVKEKQDNTKANAGSVFRYHYKLGEELKGTRVGQVSFSRKTGNWILNHGEGSADDVQALIDRAIDLHRARGLKEPGIEWTVWDA